MEVRGLHLGRPGANGNLRLYSLVDPGRDVGSTKGESHMIPLLIALFVIAGAIGYLVMLYNGLIAVKNNVDKAWANIDVLLKQRHDELPNLLEVCKGYM